MSSDNQLFLDHASRLIRSEADHPLGFLLNQDRSRVMTLEGGNLNVYDKQANAIYEGRANDGKLAQDMKPKDIAAELGVSVSCDACHTTTKQHGASERFALGIAEDNRSHGHDEKKAELSHEAIDIGGVPVIKESAQKWQEAGLLQAGTIEKAPVDAGWSRADQGQQHTEKQQQAMPPSYDERVKAEGQERQDQKQEQEQEAKRQQEQQR